MPRTGAVSALGRTMREMSRHGREDSLRGRPDSWSAVGWLLAVTVICGVADFFALPDGAVWLGMPLEGHQMFRPEWLVMGTLVALPLFKLARASFLLGLLGLFLAGGEMVTIVDNARERYVHNADLFGGDVDFPMALYALAGLQILVFTAAAGSGLRLRWSQRRWERMMRRLTAASVPPPVAGAPTGREQVVD